MKPVRALEEALECDKGRGNPHESGKPPRAAETIDDFPFLISGNTPRPER